MTSYVFKLPDLGEGTTAAEIVRWHVAAGEPVREDQPLVDMMTDKATVEITSPVAGIATALNGAPGDSIPVGSELVVFDVATGAPDAPQKTPETAAVSTPAPRPAAPTPVPPAPAGHKPEASPAVRRRARELGVSLAQVRASGKGGRVLREDLESHVAGGPGAEDVEEIKVIGLRRVIAERMQDAKRRIPHIAYIEEVDVSALEDLRARLNAAHPGAPKLTILPFLMRAIVKAAAAYPQCNAHYDDEAGIVRRYRAVHIGVATQTPAGLMVPVARHAETLDLWASAAEIARLAARAREGKATRDELSGSTITISSLGALGGLASTPIINAPEVAIIGVNRMDERPVAREGRIVLRKMMNLSSSFDHRVIDGWDAASFIQAIRASLEAPATMFIDAPGA